MMGSSTDDDDHESDEYLHKVTLNSFEMAKYEVTNLQYAVFLNKYGSDKVKTGDFAEQRMMQIPL